MPLEPGKTLLHYQIKGKIGEGGMGSVYRATDTKLNREVALKVLPADMASDPSRLERFQREARAVAALNHPHIVTIHNVEEDGDTHFLIMELVEGSSLDHNLPPGGLPLTQVYDIGIALADALAIAHERGIVHRDLKPANVMLTADDRVKVLDFGLAKLSADGGPSSPEADNPEVTSMATAVAPAPGSDSLTQAGTIMGTAPYMSPEQLEGKVVDHRTDIFALGVVLYEISTGRRPFSGGTSAALISSIMRDTPRQTTELRQDVPRPLARIIDHCLEKKVTDRFQSALDIRNQLRTLRKELDSGVSEFSGAIPSGVTPAAAGAQGSPATSGISSPALSAPQSMPSSPSFVSEVQTALPARPAVRLAVMAVVVLGVAGLAFGLYSMLSRPGTEAPTAASFQDMKISILMSHNDLTGATLSADGRYLAYVTTSDLTENLIVRQIRTGSDISILADSEIPIRGISFSPDGDYLYFRNRDPDLPNYSSLFQVASLGGAPRKISFDVDSAPAFSPDGKQYCFRRGLIDKGADSLVIANLETGEERELSRVSSPTTFQGAPAWSPDGKTIAAATVSTEGGVQVFVVTIDVESGVSTRLGQETWQQANSLGWAPGGDAVLLSAFKLDAGNATQIYQVSYPGGQVARMTNDLDGYTNISVAADGASIAAVRGSQVNNLWVARTDGTAEAEAITFASGTATSMGGIAPLPGGATAFTAPRDNKVYLWRMNADGSGRTQLTSKGEFTLNLRWSENAGLVFNRIDADEGVVGHTWRLNPDGSGLEQLTHGAGEWIVGLSPAGDSMLIQKWAEPRSLWLSRMDGSEPALLADNNSGGAIYSPDGQQILLTRIEGEEGRMFPNHYVLPVAGGDPLATFRLPPTAADIRWAPGGTDITYVDRAREWNIMRKSIPDGEAQQITRFDAGRVLAHRWHSDGSRLSVHRRIGRNSSLWQVKGDEEPTLITEFKSGNIRGHWWAPDEHILYFRYGTSSQDVVLITDFR